MSFFATNLDDEGAVLKLGKMFITMLFSDRRVGRDELGAKELPHWAEHSAHASLSYKCPVGYPPERNGTSFMLFWVCLLPNSSTVMCLVCSSLKSKF